MCFISAKVQPHNLYDKSKPTFDKQLLSNHILFENQSPNLFGAPLPLQYQVRSSQKIHDTLSEHPKFFLLCPFLPQKLLSR